MQWISVYKVLSRLKMQFHIEMDVDVAVQHCGQVLKDTAMIGLDRRIYIGKISNLQLLLPPTVWKVRGTIRLDDDCTSSMNIVVQDIKDSFPVQSFFVTDEVDPVSDSPTIFEGNYVPRLIGPRIDFVWDCPYVRFNESNIHVAIECTELKKDEEGFPKIPEEALEACVYYCLFVHYQPQFIAGKLPQNIMQQIEEWQNVRIGGSINKLGLQQLNNNERDKLFNIMTSFDRKRYNISS